MLNKVDEVAVTIGFLVMVVCIFMIALGGAITWTQDRNLETQAKCFSETHAQECWRTK